MGAQFGFFADPPPEAQGPAQKEHRCEKREHENPLWFGAGHRLISCEEEAGAAKKTIHRSGAAVTDALQQDPDDEDDERTDGENDGKRGHGKRGDVGEKKERRKFNSVAPDWTVRGRRTLTALTGLFAGLFRADAYGFVHFGDEHFAVPDFSGFGCLDDRRDGGINQGIAEDDFDFDLR